MAIGLELTWVRPTERADKSALALADISKYVIEYGIAGVALSSIDVTDNTATSYPLAPLTDGVMYRVRISVVDTNGDSSQLSGFVYGVASEIGVLPPVPDTSNLLTDSFNTLALTLDNETVTETGDGATLTIDSNSSAGTMYSYSKTTAFTGTEAEQAAEIMANGVPMAAGDTPNGTDPETYTTTYTHTGQDSFTPHYAGWVQDTDGYGVDLAMEFDVSSKSLTIPAGAGTYDAVIDWGDGETSTVSGVDPADPQHTYAAEADDTAVVRISGTFPYLRFNAAGDVLKLTKILQLGDVGWTSLNGSFNGARNCTELTAGVTDTSGVTTMFNAFVEVWALTTADLRGMDTSNVTNFQGAFYDWRSLTESPDLGVLDVSESTTLTLTLYNWVSLDGVADPKIDQWDVGKIVSFQNFLLNSGLSTGAYDRTLASWGNQTLATGAANSTIHFGSSQYTDQASKNLLLAQVAGIIDGGQANGEYHGNFLTSTQPFEFARDSVQTGEATTS